MSEDAEQLIINSLIKINDKLDKHEDKFDSIGATLKKLVAVDVEIREIKSSVGRAFDRIENVEKTQRTNGCKPFQGHLELSDEKIKGYNKIVSDYDKRIVKVEEDIAVIEAIPNKIIFRVIITAIATLVSGAIALMVFKK